MVTLCIDLTPSLSKWRLIGLIDVNLEMLAKQNGVDLNS